jgi:hypothetical protein
MTSRRTKQPTPAGQAERVSPGDLRYAGRDRRSAAQYARDLAAETQASLRSDPSRWPWRRTMEVTDSRHPHRRIAS